MADIEVDFEVFKALTARRQSEDVTYNKVIRDLLGLPDSLLENAIKLQDSCVFDGVFFEEGTQFRKTYKGKTYFAEIKGGRWIGADGKARKTPSEAAVAITKNNVNGWRFWECRGPRETAWRKMDELRREAGR